MIRHFSQLSMTLKNWGRLWSLFSRGAKCFWKKKFQILQILQSISSTEVACSGIRLVPQAAWFEKGGKDDDDGARLEKFLAPCFPRYYNTPGSILYKQWARAAALLSILLLLAWSGPMWPRLHRRLGMWVCVRAVPDIVTGSCNVTKTRLKKERK